MSVEAPPGDAVEAATIPAPADTDEPPRPSHDSMRPSTRPIAPPALSSLASLLDEDTSVGDDLELGDEEPDPYVGTVLGERYVIDRVLGEGGMGKVYRAHHKVIEKKVAIKVLHAELAKDKESVGRFLREARAASAIGNPHIVDIVDFGEAPDGATYFVMEYLNGQSLGDVLAELTRISPRTTVDLALQLCDGLAAAHAEGIVHRDLKPDNIVLVKPKGTWAGQGHFVKILDFGIAKVSDKKGNTSKLTMAGAVFGTPHYMSPEQASGETVDARTDIYSLGVMIYEMLDGDVPFRAENFMGILTQHMHKAPQPLRERSHGEREPCPPALEAIVMKCMAKQPAHRYQSMEEVAADLLRFKQTGQSEAAYADLPVADPTPTLVPPSVPHSGSSSSQGPSAVRIVAGALVAALCLIGLAFILRTRADSMAASSRPAENAAPAVSTPTNAPVADKQVTVADKQVTVSSTIEGAYAVHQGRRDKLPKTFAVPDGQKLSLRIEAGDQFVAKTIEIDGSNAQVKVELDSASPTASASASAPIAPTIVAPATTNRWPSTPPPGGFNVPRPPPPKPKTNPSGVVDPWG